jgi:hypothetical protein
MIARLRFLAIAALVYLVSALAPAQAALSIDGTPALGSSSGSATVTCTLTTSLTNDIVIIYVHINHATVSVSNITGGLTWALRKRFTGNSVGEEVWWALAATAQSAVTFTVNLSGTPTNSDAGCFAINGANTSTPWDVNGSLPATGTASSASAPTVTGVSTTNANTMLLGMYGTQTGSSSSVGASYTLIQVGGSFGNIGQEQQVVSGTQSSVTVSWTGNHNSWNMIADAIQQASPVTTIAFPLPVGPLGH